MKNNMKITHGDKVSYVISYYICVTMLIPSANVATIKKNCTAMSPYNVL